MRVYAERNRSAAGEPSAEESSDSLLSSGRRQVLAASKNASTLVLSNVGSSADEQQIDANADDFHPTRAPIPAGVSVAHKCIHALRCNAPDPG